MSAERERVCDILASRIEESERVRIRLKSDDILKYHLAGKAEGLRLALSYVEEMGR